MRSCIASTFPAARRAIRRFSLYLTLSFLFAIITGLFAQLRFYLPFTPVPFTGQVFAVLLSGLVLGGGAGSLSQLLYVLLGLAGVPWFVVGPFSLTGGYLVGFVVAPLVMGTLRYRVCGKMRGFGLASALAAGVLTINLFGALHFTIYMGASLPETFRHAFFPFIPFDLGKAAAAAMASRLLGDGRFLTDSKLPGNGRLSSGVQRRVSARQRRGT